MKKYFIILISLLCIFMFSGVIHAEDKTINCVQTMNDGVIHIQGQISGCASSCQVTLLVSDDLDNSTSSNIVYIDQTTSSDDGSFGFDFKIKDALDGDTYSYKVGSDSGAAPYIGTITISSDIQTVNQQFIDADINVNIVNYVPSISGTITCEKDKTATINIVNLTDNTIVANDALTEGQHTISYQLPSLITAKKYSLTIIGNNNTQELVLLNATIDSSILLVTISGTVDVSEGVSMDVAVQSNNSSLIDKSAVITSDKTLSATIPNIIWNTSYHLTATGYVTVPVSVPGDNEDEINTEYIYNGNAGDIVNVIAVGRNLESFDKVFTLQYNSEQITPASFYGAYYNDSTQIVQKGDVEIISAVPGIITFKKVNKQIAGGQTWSGLINIFKFKFNQNYSGETVVKIFAN